MAKKLGGGRGRFCPKHKKAGSRKKKKRSVTPTSFLFKELIFILKVSERLPVVERRKERT